MEKPHLSHRSGEAQSDEPVERPATSYLKLALVVYGIVGRGRRVHYSPRNDVTLCGREITAYIDIDEVVELLNKGYELCIPCHRRAEQRAAAARLAESPSRPTGAVAAQRLSTVQANAVTRLDHARIAQGSHPADATDPNVIAACAALTGFLPATLTGKHDVTMPTESEQSVRGYLVDPRDTCSVRVFWVEAGRIIRRDQLLGGAMLDRIADRLRSRGWVVMPMRRSSQCVIAKRPTLSAPEVLDATVQADASRDEQQVSRCVHGYALGHEVSGDPIAVCARMQPTQRVGVPVDVGFVYLDCAVAAANGCADLADNSERETQPGDDPFCTWVLMCPTHEEQPCDSCEECAAEEAAREAAPVAPAGSLSLESLAATVICPACHVAAGARCVTRAGKVASYPHGRRIDALADAAGITAHRTAQDRDGWTSGIDRMAEQNLLAVYAAQNGARGGLSA
ncbi:hypothetical protein [Streptomyces xiamenensis]|uniref:hypothetical protein n=1 Tax=Streptomyces xiamenensis TaxID=408015 RepID=UPI0035DB4C15